MDWTFAIGSMSFGILDLIVLGAIIIGGITGGAAGFTFSVSSILGKIVAFPLGILFVRPAADFVTSKVNMPYVLAAFVSYLVICVIIYVLFRAFAALLSSFFDALGLGFLDHTLGAFWGILMSVVGVMVILSILSLQPFISFAPLKASSVFYMQVYCRIFPLAENAIKGAIVAFK